jgi:3-oxoacyl-[acyl-carrier protein] reductase
VSRPVTLITGGTRGIGRATAQRLAHEGHFVIAIARKPPEAPFPGVFLPVDLADARATTAILAEVTSRYEVDNLINNAGRTTSASLLESTVEEFESVMDINLRAAFQCTQACAPAMISKKRGRIVNISSRAALGMPRRTSYSAAKGGIISLTRTWALELAPHGITVNAVAPGPVLTELYLKNNPMDEDARQGFINKVPLRRLGRPEDIAGAIVFFLSEDASFVTGQILYVCGGLSVGSAQL